MKKKVLNPGQAISPSYHLEVIDRKDFDCFKLLVADFLKKTNQATKGNQTEEHFKNQLSEFLKGTFYKVYNINTKSYKGLHEADLVICDAKEASNKVNVILEVKKPDNFPEMPTLENINRKGLWEAVQYYLWEKIEFNNNEVKHIIVTNMFQWYIFDATYFNDLFYKNTELVNQFKNWKNGATDNQRTEQMYSYIQKIIDESEDSIEFIYFDLNDYGEITYNQELFPNEPDLANIYKLLSPKHLLKIFSYESNSLNVNFYNELLYLIGLEEVSDGSKKVIKRKKDRHPGSLIENTINKIISQRKNDYILNGSNEFNTIDDWLFSDALELCITWLNRILFLKLLEVQLISYHDGNQDFAFMKSYSLREFDELETLFFEVLAVQPPDRSKELNQKYKNIPYLNSSLFEPTKLEKSMITISNLKDHIKYPVYQGTVLKDESGQKIRNKEIEFFKYLLDFLDSYNFGYVGKEIIQKDKKDLINASVLGLVFEKINGYKDGSFFTPGTITEYMSREALRLAVVQKFNDKYNWKCENLKDIYNKFSDIKEANEIINSLKICDPAVGSGHFLVSCMNEILAIKSELGVLCDMDGKKLRDYSVFVENDTLFVKNQEDGLLFNYNVRFIDGIRELKPEKQRVQSALFNEKKIIIENCLFGVDINENSVNIARLRLWIELLKNSYYLSPGNLTPGPSPQERGVVAIHELHLQTLPNIDYNIKCGNSLISRYPIDKPLQILIKDKPYIKQYRELVNKYKNVTDKGQKKKIEVDIDNCKDVFIRSGMLEKSEKNLQLMNLKRDFNVKFGANDTLHEAFDVKDEKKYQKEKDELEKKINNLDQDLNDFEFQKKTIYRKAFEWRFEFPEVLNDEGEFLGFDVVIGNPPYFGIPKDSLLKSLKNYKTLESSGDIYMLFCELASTISKDNGYSSLIISNKWLRANYGKILRKFFIHNTNPIKLIDFGQVLIFENAIVHTCIIIYQNCLNGNLLKALRFAYNHLPEKLDIFTEFENNSVSLSGLSDDIWNIADNTLSKLKDKIESIGTPLTEWDIKIYRGILTGLNEAFIIDGKKKNELLDLDPECSKFIKPILRGRDVRKYRAEFGDLWLIIIPKGFTIKTMLNIRDNIVAEPVPHYGYVDYDPAWDFIKDNYPAIANHLIKYKPQAEKRLDKGDYWWELRACAYIEEFEKEKIIYSEIVSEPQFYYDTKGYYPEATVFFMTGDHLKYLIALLNSKPVTFFFKSYYMGGELVGKIRYKKAFLENVPIPVATDEDEKNIIAIVDRIIKIKEENPKADTTKLESEIDVLVYKLYKLSYDEVKVVDPEFDLSREEYAKMV